MITSKCERFAWKFQTLNDPKLQALFSAVTAYASAMELNRPAHWLTLLGPSGIGKTHLSKRVIEFWRAVAGWRIIKGKGGKFSSLLESRFVSWRLLIDRIRSGGFSEVEDIIETPFVVLDDIGAEHDPNGFAKSVLDKIADARLGKWTIYTCNLPLKQIATLIDPRIASRMKRGLNKVVSVDTTDFSLRNRA